MIDLHRSKLSIVHPVQWWIQDFSERWGVPAPKVVGTNLLFGKICPKTAWQCCKLRWRDATKSANAISSLCKTLLCKAFLFPVLSVGKLSCVLTFLSHDLTFPSHDLTFPSHDIICHVLQWNLFLFCQPSVSDAPSFFSYIKVMLPGHTRSIISLSLFQ